MILQLLIDEKTNKLVAWATGEIFAAVKGARHESAEITEEEAAKLRDFRNELLWDGQRISFQTKAKYQQEDAARQAMKEKFESGTATQADIVEAIKQLL